jgi:LysR family hydrogen peroxide-inducible transcriptional activator
MNLTPPPVSLRQLQYIVAVAERLSFRQAAQDCRVAQPSLSSQVAQAEEALGVQLFERDRRKKVTLTEAGRALVGRARALLLAAEELHDTARMLSDPLAGALRLGLIPTLGPYLLPELAPRLREAFPRMTFLWSEEKTATLLEQISEGAVDGALLALVPEVEGMARVILGRDPFVFAAPAGHPLARGKRPLRPEELEGERVLLLDDGHCFRDQALSFCARAGSEEAEFRATSLSTLVQMAAGGVGVTLLPSTAVAVENRHQALRVRPFAAGGPSRTVALVWRKNAARTRTLEAVGKALREVYQRLQAPARPPRQAGGGPT